MATFAQFFFFIFAFCSLLEFSKMALLPLKWIKCKNTMVLQDVLLVNEKNFSYEMNVLFGYRIIIYSFTLCCCCFTIINKMNSNGRWNEWEILCSLHTLLGNGWSFVGANSLLFRFFFLFILCLVFGIPTIDFNVNVPNILK